MKQRSRWYIAHHQGCIPIHNITMAAWRAPRTLQWGGRGGADPEAMYNLCMILETMLQNHLISIPTDAHT